MSTSFTAENLEAALTCAAAGGCVFPAKAIYNHEVQRWNKPPAIIDWRSTATTDSRTIEDWWRRNPDAIPAICCTEVVVIDADRHKGGDGVAALKALGIRHAEWPDHPIVLTPGDGEHHYFAQSNPALGNRTGTLPRGIDVRGVGGFVIAPGAVLPDGKRWQMIAGFSTNLPPLPQWLECMILADRDDVVSVPCIGNSAGSRERRYAAAALEACRVEVMAAPTGKRNTTLNHVAYRLGRMIARGWTDRSDVEHCLLRAAFRLQLEDGRASIIATIKTGIDAGYRNPHPDLGDRNGRDR